METKTKNGLATQNWILAAFGVWGIRFYYVRISHGLLKTYIHLKKVAILPDTNIFNFDTSQTIRVTIYAFYFCCKRFWGVFKCMVLRNTIQTWFDQNYKIYSSTHFTAPDYPSLWKLRKLTLTERTGLHETESSCISAPPIISEGL